MRFVGVPLLSGPLAIFDAQKEAKDKTIEDDCRRSNVSSFERKGLDKPTLLIDARVQLRNSAVCFGQLNHRRIHADVGRLHNVLSQQIGTLCRRTARPPFSLSKGRAFWVPNPMTETQQWIKIRGQAPPNGRNARLG
jgi:hypothetical protein